jgi:RES domain-containing protein
VADDSTRARDIALLDSIDAFKREHLEANVWRVTREGRDPALGSPSRSRWCNGRFDVLYTCFEQDGAIAEIYALLSLQPVFPSKDRWFAHRLRVIADRSLKLADLPALARLGVDIARYAERNYSHTQEIADAAYFLGFDGLIVPSARWPCSNLVLFTEQIPPEQIEIAESSADPIDWTAWRKKVRSSIGNGTLPAPKI